jgi:addiction module HigA family antidote
MTSGEFVFGSRTAMPWTLRLSTITESESMKTIPNIHPGEILWEEFLVPMGISQNALARAISVPPRRINEIVLGKRAVTADTALRLARYFGTSERFWIGLQADYDLEEARKSANLESIRPRAA